jgi:hypothetical protein
MPVAEHAPELDVKEDNRTRVAAAIQRAKAMNARLRLMKERNEHYLAERRLEEDEAGLPDEL